MKNIHSEVWSWVKCILVGIALALALDLLVIANARVPTGSMEDTIPVGARIIGLRHSYILEEPQRGDIIIFKYPDDIQISVCIQIFPDISILKTDLLQIHIWIFPNIQISVK